MWSEFPGSIRALLDNPFVFQSFWEFQNGKITQAEWEQRLRGGATWDGSVNRSQLRDCTKLLGKRVPLIILLMLDNPRTPWGGCLLPSGRRITHHVGSGR